MVPRSLAAGAALLLAATTLTACSSSTDPEAASPSPPAACPVTVADPWVKAAESGMTAAFGTLTNTSPEEVTITAASSPSAVTTELHEVVDADGSMVMRPAEGGFSVAAQGTQVLEPGGYHLMLMDVTAPIEPGAEVAFTLTCATGATTSFTAQAKTYEGADEEYTGDGMEMPSPASS